MIRELFIVKEDGELVGKLRRRPIQRTELLERGEYVWRNHRDAGGWGASGLWVGALYIVPPRLSAQHGWNLRGLDWHSIRRRYPH